MGCRRRLVAVNGPGVSGESAAGASAARGVARPVAAVGETSLCGRRSRGSRVLGTGTLIGSGTCAVLSTAVLSTALSAVGRPVLPSAHGRCVDMAIRLSLRRYRPATYEESLWCDETACEGP